MSISANENINENIKFIPKTRLQVYKEALFVSSKNIPNKYFIEETETLIDNKELIFQMSNSNYRAFLCDSRCFISDSDIVKIDNVTIPPYDSSATYQTGDLYLVAEVDHGNYAGISVISVGASPSGTKHASVYRTIKKCTLLPKTPIETYFAAVSGLFDYDGPFEIPEPKTVNEKLTIFELGGDGEFDISPKTRSQWYRAKALGLVEEVPSKIEQVALAEDVMIAWTAAQEPGAYYCDIYEPEGGFSGYEDILVTLNGHEIPFATENFYSGGTGTWNFENGAKIRVHYYFGKNSPVFNDFASAYLAKAELSIPPKTNIEKYYAYKAGLYEGELPEPKTVDEYYIALECGCWEPAGQEPDLPGQLLEP